MLKSLLKKVENEEISKSEMFRKLYKNGYSISEISNETDNHYSFVYNVIKNYSNKNDDIKLETNNKSNKISKSDLMKELYMKSDISISKISEICKTNYSYCWKVIDDLRKNDEEIQKLSDKFENEELDMDWIKDKIEEIENK